MKYFKTYTASASFCDSVPKLSVIGSFQIVQDAVCDFFALNNIDGLTIKEKYNAMWVFAKNKLEFFKQIEYNQNFNVECFISNVGSVTLLIDTIFKNNQGEILLYSLIEACPMDIATQKVIRLSSINIDKTFEIEATNQDVKLEKLEVQNASAIETINVSSTSIDMSNHTNNVEYVRFLLNTYSIEELKNLNLQSFEINYVWQSHANDSLTINKISNEQIDMFEITNSENRAVVRAKLKKSFNG